MKTLERMLSMAQLTLDTERRALSDLEAVREDLANRIIRIDGEIASEMAAAETNPELLRTLSEYLRAARDRQARLRNSIADLDAQIEAAREKVSEAFREKKRFEQVLESRKAERKRRLDRREQSRLDELGQQRGQRAAS